MNQEQRREAIGLYDDYTHGGIGRRSFVRRMVALTGSLAAAETIISAIAADPAAAQLTKENDPRVSTSTISWPVTGGRTMSGYMARPSGPHRRRPVVVVIHENRGLNAHIRDVTRRLALERFTALAPDFLWPAGGTPADQDRAREMISGLDAATATADAVETVEQIGRMPIARGARIGAIGFCWGGAMVNRMALSAGPRLSAGVSFYGPAPDPAEAERVRAAMLLILAERDERVNRTALPWMRALEAAGKGRGIVFPGVDHAFHNDTSRERYDAAAAARAWQEAVRHLGRHLRTRG